MAGMGGTSFASLLVIVSCFSFSNAGYVPVLFLGSDSDHLPPDPASAVQKLTTKEFEADYFNKLREKGPVVVACQDTLSLEDFSLFGNAYNNAKKKSTFQNLEKALDERPSLLLPAVDNPEKALTGSSDLQWKVVEVKDPNQSLKANGIELGKNVLVIVRLPKTSKDAAEREKTLQANDQVIGDLLKELGKSGHGFSLLYTAFEPSWKADTVDDEVRVSRHLLAAAEANSLDDCVFRDDRNITLFYMASVQLLNGTAKGSKEMEYNLTCSGFNLTVSNTTDNLTMKLEYTKPTDGLTTFFINFLFRKDRGNWVLLNAHLTLKTDRDERDNVALKIASQIWAPLGFSYTCGAGVFSIKDDVDVVFENMQVEPFVDQKRALEFGDAMDCVGFFTIPIWMSIFVTILLLLILSFGIQLVLSINTMDRFDDPKGKTITIANAD